MDRNERFSVLYQNTIEHFISTPHIVIGCGAIGGPIIKILGQVGVDRLTLWDHDIVELVNVGPQGFMPDEINDLKVHSRQTTFLQLTPESECIPNETRFRKTYEHEQDAYWWLCVDSLDARELIFNTALDFSPHKLIDTRMGGLNYEIYNADYNNPDRYLDTITYARENPVQEGCTSRSTPHTAMLSASIGINMGLTENPPFSVIGNMMDYNQEVVW